MNFLDENGLGRLWAQIILKLNSKVPDGGTTGQILKKTENGTEWADGIGLGVTGATVGDIIKVASVDADGKPTAWEATENGFSILDKSAQISTTWGDNITWQIKSFTRWGSLCLVTIQFVVDTAIESTYGFTVATLPYASMSRVWLSNQTEFWIDAGGKNIRRNGSSLGTGAKIMTCFYLTLDPE